MTNQSSLAKLREQAPTQTKASFQSGRDLAAAGLQQQLSQAPASQNVTAQSQQAAGQAQQQQGQQVKQAMQQQQTSQQLAGQSQMQAKATELQQRAADQTTAMSELQTDMANRLQDLDMDNKQKLLDQQLKIHRDARGREMLTERQLLDYAVLSSKNEQEFQAWQDDMEDASRRNIMMLEAAQKRVNQELQQSFRKAETAENQALQKKLLHAKQELERKQREAQNRAKNKMMKYQAVGSVVGAGVGFVASGGNPYGAMAGAQIGGAAGSYAAGSGK
jgi:hypothetical protein